MTLFFFLPQRSKKLSLFNLQRSSPGLPWTSLRNYVCWGNINPQPTDTATAKQRLHSQLQSCGDRLTAHRELTLLLTRPPPRSEALPTLSATTGLLTFSRTCRSPRPSPSKRLLTASTAGLEDSTVPQVLPHHWDERAAALNPPPKLPPTPERGVKKQPPPGRCQGVGGGSRTAVRAGILRGFA